eukprot:TRINITY_DN7562_c0_g1_i1.p1 TRINITY_DN7562_c0_g1~~TRINITY_DN7562_c0_g1_i1.p1  ORF type:complete len:730 (-),score=140.99 TRINITY_DN7562_c0_g1_i1:39-2201(-)
MADLDHYNQLLSNQGLSYEESILDEIDGLTCNVCYDVFANEKEDIMSLISKEENGYCNHNLCLPCFKESAEDGSFLCPECRREIVGAERNIAAMKMVEYILKNHSSNSNETGTQDLERELSDAKDRLLQIEQERLEVERNSTMRIEQLQRNLADINSNNRDLLSNRTQLEKMLGELQDDSVRALELERELEIVRKRESLSLQNIEKLENDLENERMVLEQITLNSTNDIEVLQDIVYKKEQDLQSVIQQNNQLREQLKNMSNRYHTTESSTEEDSEGSDVNEGTTHRLFGYFEPFVSAAVDLITPSRWNGDLILDHTHYEDRERRGRNINSPVRRVVYNSNDFASKIVLLPDYVYKPPDNQESPVKERRRKKDEFERNYQYYSQWREALILSNLDHLNIISVKGIIRNEITSYKLIMNYLSCDLDYFCKQIRPEPPTLQEIKFIFYRVLCAVSYLHSAEIVHRDINNSSILLRIIDGKVMNIQLASFGKARSLLGPYSKNPISGTDPVRYRDIRILTNNQPDYDGSLQDSGKVVTITEKLHWPPELISLHETGSTIQSFHWKKCDIWAVGCCLAQSLRCGDPLFCSSTLNELLVEILKIDQCVPGDPSILQSGAYVHFGVNTEICYDLFDVLNVLPQTRDNLDKIPILSQNDTAGMQCVSMMANMLKLDPNERLHASDLLRDPFFENIKNNNLEAPCKNGLRRKLPDKKLVDFVMQCGGP